MIAQPAGRRLGAGRALMRWATFGAASLLCASAAGVPLLGGERPGPDNPAAVARAAALVAKMTLDEKLQLVHGTGMYPVSGFAGDTCISPAAPSHSHTCEQFAVPRLRIPPVLLADGPMGFKTGNRKGNIPHSTTQFPALVAVAASWDPQLAHALGAAMGAEFRAKGANVQEGPGMNVHRVQRGGRNSEYIAGEDPVLGAALAPALVRGIQSQGVVATAKHWVVNNQEDNRQGVSANVRPLLSRSPHPGEAKECTPCAHVHRSTRGRCTRSTTRPGRRPSELVAAAPSCEWRACDHRRPAHRFFCRPTPFF